MDPITILIALAPAVVGGLVKMYGEHEASARAQEILNRARDSYGALNPDTITKAAQQMLPPTALAAIQVDPSYRSAQREALAAMQGIARGGGLDLADRANLNEIQNDSAHRATQERESMLDRFSARGMAGSGAEVAASLAGQQSEANRNSQAGLSVAGDARRRALDAYLRSAQLAGQMGDTDWNRQAKVASAQDEIAKLNRDQQYRGAVDSYNAGLQRAAGMSGFAPATAGYAYSGAANAGEALGGGFQQAGNMWNSRPRTSEPSATPEPNTTVTIGDEDPTRAFYDPNDVP